MPILELETISQNAGNLQEDVYRNLLEKRKILINGEIDEYILEKAIIPLLEMDKNPDKLPIEILINSPGGGLFNGMPLCNVIENLRCPTTITVFGQALSMAFYIVVAGANNPNVRRRAYPFSIFLLHSGTVQLSGTTMSVKDTQQFSDTMENKLKDFIVSHTRISKDMLDEKTRHEWWLSASGALSLGIIDEIIGWDDQKKEYIIDNDKINEEI